MFALIVLAAVTVGYFALRCWVRWSAIVTDHGRQYDAWGQFFTEAPGGLRMYRINNAGGERGPFYAVDLGKDRTGRRVCGWWDLNAARVVFIRPRGGRWLRRDEPPRPLSSADLRAMKESAVRHAEWLADPLRSNRQTFGSLPAPQRGYRPPAVDQAYAEPDPPDRA